MKIRVTAGCLVLLAATLLSSSLAQAEQQHKYSVGQGFEFSSGTYGSNTRTASVYAPLTIIAIPTDRLGVSLEIPFVYQNNGNSFSTIARGGMQSNRAMMRPAAGMGAMPGAMNGTPRQMSEDMSGQMSGRSPNSAVTPRSQAGLGDLTLKAVYLLLTENESVPQLRATLSVKFPTADRSLGTGEFDEGVALEVSKWFGDLNPFAEAGYVVQGRSSRFALRDYLAYNAGVGYQVTGKLRPLFLVKGATPPAHGVGSLLEGRLKLKYQVTGQIGIDGYLAKGMTTSSPDYGAGVSLYYDF